MTDTYFDQEEMALMAIFAAKTRQKTINVLNDVLEELNQAPREELDEDMPELLSSLIDKLQQIQDQYFYSLDLQEYLNNIEEETEDA